ncbi:LysR family transcriptional regulator [Pseudomonas putida]|uniref:LysR family transcriptional regulator n=1 Tax=Pseudomonas putida TaxID=303 RepID=UPI00383A4E23
MEIRQLRHFIALAEESNFTRAAARVHIVQSALSTSIRSLEDELGAALFTRTTRQVSLTAAGEVFLDKARAVLDAVRESEDAVADTLGLRRGRLSIGTVHSLSAFIDLPALLADFHQRYPDIEVQLLQGSTQHLIDKVRSRQLDLAILPITEPPPELKTTLIVCEDMVFTCHPEHPLARHERLGLADITGQTFVDFEPAFGIRKLVDSAFAAQGLERRIAFEVSDLLTQLELVGHGLGVALVPETVARAHDSGLATVRLDAEICWELVVAYSPQGGEDELPDPAPAAFLDLLKAREALCPAS